MTRVEIPTSGARQRRIKQSHGVDPRWGLLICGAAQAGRQASVVRWAGGNEMCGRLPRVPRIAASDHSASRQTPEQEAAGRESGNHVPFPATSSDSMTVYDLICFCASRYPPCRRAERGLEHDNRYSTVESCRIVPEAAAPAPTETKQCFFWATCFHKQMWHTAVSQCGERAVRATPAPGAWVILNLCLSGLSVYLPRKVEVRVSGCLGCALAAMKPATVFHHTTS